MIGVHPALEPLSSNVFYKTISTPLHRYSSMQVTFQARLCHPIPHEDKYCQRSRVRSDDYYIERERLPVRTVYSIIQVHRPPWHQHVLAVPGTRYQRFTFSMWSVGLPVHDPRMTYACRMTRFHVTSFSAVSQPNISRLEIWSLLVLVPVLVPLFYRLDWVVVLAYMNVPGTTVVHRYLC